MLLGWLRQVLVAAGTPAPSTWALPAGPEQSQEPLAPHDHAAAAAAWMALVPGLRSLEVENAADWTIGVATHFPPGWLLAGRPRQLQAPMRLRWQ